MHLLLIAFITYTAVFGLLWHNKSSREGDPEPLRTTGEQAKSDAKPANTPKPEGAMRVLHDWLKG